MSLLQAAKTGDLSGLGACIKDGQDPDKMYGDMTPLMWASYYEQPLCVRELLTQSVRVNTADSVGGTALDCAALSPDPTVASMLIHSGADLEARRRYVTQVIV